MRLEGHIDPGFWPLARVLERQVRRHGGGAALCVYHRGRPVVDVIDEATRIVHVVEGEAPKAGSRVDGVIDGERRAHHRQQHTGQHVLSRVIGP